MVQIDGLSVELSLQDTDGFTGATQSADFPSYLSSKFNLAKPNFEAAYSFPSNSIITVNFGSDGSEPSFKGILGSVRVGCRVALVGKNLEPYYMLAQTTHAVLRGLWYLEEEPFTNNMNYANVLNREPNLSFGSTAPTWVTSRFRFTQD